MRSTIHPVRILEVPGISAKKRGTNGAVSSTWSCRKNDSAKA